MASSSVAISADASKLDWRKMNKQELRDALASRGLDTSGLRPLLIQRLESSLKPSVPSSSSSSSSVDVPDLQTSLIKSSVGKKEISIAPSSKNQPAKEIRTLSTQDEERNGKILPNLAEEKEKHTHSISAIDFPAEISEKSPTLDHDKDATTDKKSEFNVSARNNLVPLSDLDKKRKRAERFGVGLKVSEEEKLALRAERFAGAPGKKKSSTSEPESEKRKQRAARFGIVDETTMKKAHQERQGTAMKQREPEDAKRKARAERFGNNKQDSLKAKAT